MYFGVGYSDQAIKATSLFGPESALISGTSL